MNINDLNKDFTGKKQNKLESKCDNVMYLYWHNIYYYVTYEYLKSIDLNKTKKLLQNYYVYEENTNVIVVLEHFLALSYHYNL